MQQKRVLITDLDNTLYDWVAIWYEGFRALVDRVTEMSGVDRDILLSEIRVVHQRHRTSEYTFLLQELPSLRERHPRRDIAAIYADAIHAHNSARLRALRLYPSVRNTLKHIANVGATIVAYTESMAFHTNYRIRQLNLDGLIDYLYSSPDHDFPAGVGRRDIRKYSTREYRLMHTVHRHTPKGVLKPSREILEAILEEIDVSPHDAVYVGDSLMKDVRMARDVGVEAVLASYGQVQSSAPYELLRRVSHWTDEDIERERQILRGGTVVPDLSVDSFGEILDHYAFASTSRV